MSVRLTRAARTGARSGFVLDVEPKDVASGVVKVVLGLVWQLILRFQLGAAR